MQEGIGAFISFVSVGLLFIGIGVFSLKSKKPVSFFTFYKVTENEVSDAKAYNKAVGILWVIYGVFWALLGSLFIFLGETIGGIFIMFLSFPSVIVLILVYLRIKGKYEVKK